MIEIPLTQGAVAIIDDADLPLVASYSWWLHSGGYAGTTAVIDGERVCLLMHRLITGAPPKSHVDHRDGNKLDNRRSNLRVTTPSINQVNRKRLSRNNRSGARGVDLTPWNTWRARITVDGRQRVLGSFATRDAAVAARRAAELEHYGELCP